MSARCGRCDYGASYAQCTCNDAPAELGPVDLLWDEQREAHLTALEMASARVWQCRVDDYYAGRGPAPRGEGHR